MICMTAMCGVLTLSSCSEEVMNMEGPSTDSGAGQSQLRVTTRGDGDTPFQSRLYVFNAADQCVQQLSPDANGQLVTTTLPAGTYDLYGIGSDDLSHFVWPSADDAIPTMAITVAEGQPMGDLMMGHETITLSDGDHETLDIQLTRKVTHVNSILIHEVPDEVEQVSVAVSPMYQSILLNGTLADPSGTYTVNLMNLGSGDWGATPDEIILPSLDKPTITITFTKATTNKSYTYAAAHPIKPNTHLTLEGTFTGLQGIVLTATMSGQDWEPTPNDLSFDFDEFPIAGQPYQGYFVVANDPAHRTATLLHDTRVSYTAPANNTQANWLAAINAAMNSLPTPTFAGANALWRLPTEAECQVFSKNTDYVMSFSPTNGYGYFYFYQNDATLKWGGYQDTGSTLKYVSGTNCVTGIVLQPVIDITY